MISFKEIFTDEENPFVDKFSEHDYVMTSEERFWKDRVNTRELIYDNDTPIGYLLSSQWSNHGIELTNFYIAVKYRTLETWQIVKDHLFRFYKVNTIRQCLDPSHESISKSNKRLGFKKLKKCPYEHCSYRHECTWEVWEYKNP